MTISEKNMILSLSGGLDSASLLFEYKDRIALAVSFDYGASLNKVEQKYAKKLAQLAGVPHRIINIQPAFAEIKSALLDENIQKNNPEVQNCVVPFRNGIFLSVLAGIADSLDGVKYIALANHHDDGADFPDCRPEFSEAMDKAISLGTEHHIEFFRPYINISKRELVKRGIAHGLNPDWTYSCYRGLEPACGVCPSCTLRKKSLEGLTW